MCSAFVGDSDDLDFAHAQNIKKKGMRACDRCRKAKVRCQVDESNGEDSTTCQNCKQAGQPCTFLNPAKKRGPPKGYVEQLERRVLTLERLLRSLAPSVELSTSEREAGNEDAPTTADSTSDSLQHAPLQLGAALPAGLVGPSVTEAAFTQTGVSQPQLEALLEVHENNRKPGEDLIHGMASGSSWLRALALYKNGMQTDPSVNGDLTLAEAAADQREETMYSTFTDTLSHDISNHFFPPQDLFQPLINIYFERFHSLTPVLHRPSFELAIRNDDHLTDNAFKSLVFAVLAVASRFSDDPRVLQDFGYLPPDRLLAFGPLRPEPERLASDDPSYISLEHTRSIPQSSAGWAFAYVVSCAQTPLFATSTLADLQASLLLVHHVAISAGLNEAWSLLGFYIRRAQDAGLHRRGSAANASFMEQELRRRLWWSFFLLDRFLSASLGRPVAIRDDEYDVELPRDIDDDALLEMQQSPRERNKKFTNPSSGPITTMLQRINLTFMTGKTIKRLPVMDSTAPPTDGAERQDQRKVAELDASLNTWLNKLPEYLTWSPSQPDLDVFTQSSSVLSQYYYTQLALHREYISPEKSKGLGFPSLAICVNAARSLVHVVHTAAQRGCLESLLPWCITKILSAAMLLLINVYASGRVEELADGPLSDVDRCLEALSVLKDRCIAAKTMHSTISRLADLNELRRMQPITQPQGSDYTDNTSSSNSSVEDQSSRRPALRTRSRLDAPRVHQEEQQSHYFEQPARAGKRARLGGNPTPPPSKGFDAVLPAAAPSFNLPTHSSDLSIPTFQDQPNFLPSSDPTAAFHHSEHNGVGMNFMPDMSLLDSYPHDAQPYEFQFPAPAPVPPFQLTSNGGHSVGLADSLHQQMSMHQSPFRSYSSNEEATPMSAMSFDLDPRSFATPPPPVSWGSTSQASWAPPAGGYYHQ